MFGEWGWIQIATQGCGHSCEAAAICCWHIHSVSGERLDMHACILMHLQSSIESHIVKGIAVVTYVLFCAGTCNIGKCDELGRRLCFNQLFFADANLVLLDPFLEGAGHGATIR